MCKITKFGVISAIAMFLATPVYAAKQTMDDQDLASITGKGGNQTTISGPSSLDMHQVQTAGSVQTGYFQWSDDHSADGSNHKGSNDESGARSRVQQNIAVTENSLAWGGPSQSVTLNTAPIGGNQVTQAWWTMFLGGF